MRYDDFIESKRMRIDPSGFDVSDSQISPVLFDWQRDIVKWALRKGKACLWEDCGLGKTFQGLEWSRLVSEHTGSPVLNVAPLAVSRQTIKEGAKIGLVVTPCRTQDDVRPGVNITNYEMLTHFDPYSFSGINLDESGIIKNYAGYYRNYLIENWSSAPFRLSCTATPAPNDHMELGNQSEWTGVMTRTEMLSTFFVHDGGDTAKWRLKGHARSEFWRWVAQWAVMIQRPSDIGYSDTGFDLPPLRYHQHIIKSSAKDGRLFVDHARSLTDRRDARRRSLTDRVKRAAELANSTDEQFICWCDLNDESAALRAAIPDAIEVKGQDDRDCKEQALIGFAEGKYRVLVTKPKIAGLGMNLQNCRNMAFVGLSDSFEALYQAVRRCWRFGQDQEVNAHIIISEEEGSVLDNIKRKEADAETMIHEMVANMADITAADVRATVKETEDYQPKIKMEIPQWLRLAA